jgi:hypothetical protein
MSCNEKEDGPSVEGSTFHKVRKHMKEFVEATPEQHKQ